MIKKKKKFKRFVLILSLVISFLFFSIVITLTYLYNKYDLNINELTNLNNGVNVVSAQGVDATLYNTNRSIIDINTLPDYVKNAFIDTEDKRFYSHNGYDIKRIIKSAFVNLNSKSKSQGASTISQQLIKNTLLTNEKTYSRKIQEIILSIKMEKQFDKDEILEMYLNTIYFGSNAYGIENASKTYFNKSAKDLTLNEACCLAGLIKAPAHYSPKTNYNNAYGRKNLVAKNLFENKHITKQEFAEVSQQPIILYENKTTDNSYEEEAIYEACRLLNLSERELINNNYQILTFKQDDLQNKVEEVNNEIIFKAEKDTNSTLDSLSIVSNNSGHVLAYFSNSNYDLHNLKRQPASTLKPLAVYLPCFEHDILSPASVILDEEINYNGFSPKNADNTFHGYVSCRNALANSLNVPAVKALDYLGVKKAKDTLSNLGINISPSDLNLSLALGAVKQGVSLLDLLSAYMVLANQGYYNNLCFVNKILDKNGNVIYSHENYNSKVADEASCFMITDILKDCAKTGTAKRFESLGLNIASKTGTASNKKGNTDLLNIAYTTEHSMLTWVSDISNNFLPSNLFSSIQPTEINKNICEFLYKETKPKNFSIPNSIQKVGYDLNEYENNHILAKPNHSIQRFIAYDYFKETNLPETVLKEEFLFDVSISETGALLSFDATKGDVYNVYKKVKQTTSLLDIIKEQNGTIVIHDKNIFRENEIEYFITNANNEVISDYKKIRPKDYLITKLNNELLAQKKKWLV